MKGTFEKRVSLILAVLLFVLCVSIGIPLKITEDNAGAEGSQPETTASATESATFISTAADTEVQVVSEVAEIRGNSALSSKNAKSSKTTRETSESSTKKSSSSSKTTKSTEATEPISFATAPSVANKASYTAQWNAGYLVAIDNPDKNYSCPHVELTDENRELLERVCMGEFSVGGFTGAALIAQAVKNAMASYGIEDVQTVIEKMHYTRRLSSKPSRTVKNAVIYVFDMDKDAIQHRILYMYNPNLVQSAFHESQSYICTFKNVRFFDKK